MCTPQHFPDWRCIAMHLVAIFIVLVVLECGISFQTFETSRYGGEYARRSEIVTSWSTASKVNDALTNMQRMLMNEAQRLEAIQKLSEEEDLAIFTQFSRTETKVLIASVIASPSIKLLRSIIAKLLTANKLDASLMHIALHMVQERGDVALLCQLFNDAVEFGLPVDSSLVQAAVEEISIRSNVKDSDSHRFKLTEQAHKKLEIDKYVQVGVLYKQISAGSSKVMNSSTMINTARQMVNNPDYFTTRRGRSTVSDQLFTFIRACSFYGDLSTALTIFGLYSRSFPKDYRAHAMILSSYQTWLSDIGHNIPVTERSDRNGVWNLLHSQMDAFVAKILLNNDDQKDTTLCHGLMRYFCVQNDARCAVYYLQRIMRREERLSTAALTELTALIQSPNTQQQQQTKSDNGMIRLLASTVHCYCNKMQLFVPLSVEEASMLAMSGKDGDISSIVTLIDDILLLFSYSKAAKSITTRRYCDLLMRRESPLMELDFLVPTITTAIEKAGNDRQLLLSCVEIAEKVYNSVDFNSNPQQAIFLPFFMSILQVYPVLLARVTVPANEQLRILDLYIKIVSICLQYESYAANRNIIFTATLPKSLPANILTKQLQTDKVSLYFEILLKKLSVFHGKETSFELGKPLPTELDLSFKTIKLAHMVVNNKPRSAVEEAYVALKRIRYLWSPIDRSNVLALLLSYAMKLSDQSFLMTLLRDIFSEIDLNNSIMRAYNGLCWNLVLTAILRSILLIESTPSLTDSTMMVDMPQGIVVPEHFTEEDVALDIYSMEQVAVMLRIMYERQFALSEVNRQMLDGLDADVFLAKLDPADAALVSEVVQLYGALDSTLETSSITAAVDSNSQQDVTANVADARSMVSDRDVITMIKNFVAFSESEIQSLLAVSN